MSMNYLDQFQKHVANHDYPSFLTLWEEYCLGDEVDGEELKRVLKGVKESDLAVPFGRHVEKGLILWEKIQATDLGHEVYKLIIDLQTTNEPELGKQILDYLKARYPEDAYYHDKIRLIGLREGKDFQGAVSNYELLTHMKKGNFVFHTGGWGVGEIMEISFLREQLSLEFDYVSGRKDLSFQNAFKTLIPLKDDHFLSLRFGNPDELEQRAKKSPIDVIHSMLRDLGPLTAAEIKEELCELVIPTDEWVRWWQTARSKVKKDTMVEIPSDIRQPFRLREAEVTHEETLQKALEKKPNAETLIQMVYAFLRDFPGTLKNDAFRMDLQQKMKDALESEELSDAQELQLYFFLEDLEVSKDSSQVAELIKRFTSPDDVIRAIEVIAFKKRALVVIRKLREDWIETFLNLLLTIDQNPIRDYILTELLKAKKEPEVIKKIEELLSFPSRHPNVLMWYFQKIMKAESPPFASQDGKNRFFESFLILLSTLEQSSGHRDLIKKMHTFLTSGRYANVRKIFQKANIETVQEFLLLATKCHSLSDHDIKIFHSLAEVVHPSLAKLSKKYEEQTQEDETPIWTTEAGYRKIKERIHAISTVETVENAKEIEVARSHGDLRENAEFKAALERRDRLQSELKTLSAQFNRARILTKADVQADQVNVGVIIDCEGEDGSKVSYTLLGPWDADPDQHILSFQSKLAQSMIGNKVGDKVNIQGKQFTIASLRNYFDNV
ncbi:GreA/GreB family elongation factor [Simkania sp.]|uniref:GreA/GreB family elongation factor n=1 Tax=Simkania sp. TaxID=34094 RepID=UPI003B523209